MLALPPYALAAPQFPFRALAGLAGRSQMGGEREVVLAALMTARLADGMLPPHALPRPARASRAAAARAWFASLTLQAAFRVPFARLIDETASDDHRAAAQHLALLRELLDPHLDPPAAAELDDLARRLAGPA